MSFIVRRFISNRAIVARPTGVFPRSASPLADHSKCTSQESIRGLNSTTASCVIGSIAAVWANLDPLQNAQAQTRFSAIVRPPLLMGRK